MSNVIKLTDKEFQDIMGVPKSQVINLYDIENQDEYVKYKLIRFPDGQTTFELLQELDGKKKYCILTRLVTGDDFLNLGKVADVLERLELNYDVVITYLTTARSDRLFDINKSFDLKVTFKLLNAMLNKKSNVKILDLHSSSGIERFSDGSTPTYEEVSIYEMSEYLRNYLVDKTLIFPDKGSKDRYYDIIVKSLFLQSHLLYNNLAIFFNKKRNLETGEIIGIEPEESHLQYLEMYDEKTCPEFVIIDDLCDGGSTFINIAKWFEEHGINPKESVTLVTPHMVQMWGIERVAKVFKKIITTDSKEFWSKDNHVPKNVEVISLA